MPKDPSPLLGYNNNIRHKNRVFHVQTEDSGVRHPHIITHLFMDGGRILKSVKTSYAEHVGAEKMADVVRQMMKEQHKAMLIALRDGQFDPLLEDTDKPPARAGAGGKASPVQPLASVSNRDPGVAHAETLPNMTTPAGQRRPSIPAARGPEATIPDSEEGPATTRNLSGAPAARDELTLDIDALERAAAESTPMFEPQSDLPPPPANVLRERGTGGQYRTVTTPAPVDEVRAAGRPGSQPPPPSRPPGSRPLPRPPSSRPPRKSPPPPVSPRYDPRAERPSGTGPAAAKPGKPPPPPSSKEGRYAPARPAAIFGQARPKRGNSIFGEDLISDKSLDEVILSYLAEDLESPSSEKKRNK